MLRKFDENVKLLVERMNEQVKSRRMYYARELHAIEDAFIKERQELLDKYDREWKGKLEERSRKEVQQRLVLRSNASFSSSPLGAIRCCSFRTSRYVRARIATFTRQTSRGIQRHQSETGESSSRAATEDRRDESCLPAQSGEVRVQLQSPEET